jgi:pyrroloquinoline-quinone synthase
LAREVRVSRSIAEEPAAEAPRVTARAVRALERVGIDDNPYFRALEEGSLALEAFRETQEQFYFAVEFFSRPMAGLLAKIPDPRQRLSVLENLVEEHGDFDAPRFHEATFRRFLGSIGADPDRVHEAVVWPEVRAFNSCLVTACVHDELEVGVACMGVIERAFASISARIGQAVVKRGWVPEKELAHYRLHAAIDERHADEFFRIVETRWDDPKRRYYIEQGLELGAYIFDRLYADLHRRAVKRSLS